MEDIGTVPSTKQYRFSNCSWTCMCVLTAAIICILLPFFLVFSVDGFYMSAWQVYEQPTITYINKYYISARTSSTIAVSSNMLLSIADSSMVFSSIQVSEQDTDGDRKPQLFIFEAELIRPLKRIQRIDVVLLFKLKTTYVSAPALVSLSFNGNQISYASAVGTLELLANDNMNITSNDLGDTNPFESQLYNITAAMQNYTQQAVYLLPRVSKQVINDDTEKTYVKIQLNLDRMVRQPVAASIFQQFIWSWCQYLPVALMFIIIGYYMLLCCFEYEMLDSRVNYQL